MTSFKSLQKVATKVVLRNEKGHPIGVGTHLTVIRQDGDQVTMRQAKKEGHEGRAFRVIAKASQLATTSPGRPRKGTKSQRRHGAPTVTATTENVEVTA